MLSQLATRPMLLGRLVIAATLDGDKRSHRAARGYTSGQTRLSRRAVARRAANDQRYPVGAVTPTGAADASDAPSRKRFLGVCAGARGEDEDGRATISRKETR